MVIEENGDWIELRVFRQFYKLKKISEENGEQVLEEIKDKGGFYKELFLRDGIIKIEPYIYHPKKPPSKNYCMVHYRPDNLKYKVKGSYELIKDKLNMDKIQQTKIGFRYGNENK